MARRAVVTSQLPRRSGSRNDERFSTTRSQVSWQVSSHSACRRPIERATVQTTGVKRVISSRQAASSPARHRCTSSRVRVARPALPSGALWRGSTN